MARRCKCGCGAELPPAAKCADPYQKQRFLNQDHMVQFGLQAAKKKREKEIRAAENKEKKARREARRRKIKFYANDVNHQLTITQRVFNRMVKLEKIAEALRAGKNPVCISCGKPFTFDQIHDFAAGHYKTVGAHEELRFNTLNVELQCNRYCNKGLSGNINGNKNSHGYMVGLAYKYGEDAATDRMLYLEQPWPNFTRNAAVLKKVREWCSARNRVLEKELGID